MHFEHALLLHISIMNREAQFPLKSMLKPKISSEKFYTI